MRRWLEEVRGAAKAIVDAERSVVSRLVPGSGRELIRGLQSELASFGENQALLLWAYERALEILSPISRGELAEPVTDQAPSRTLTYRISS